MEYRAPERDRFAWQGPVIDKDLTAPPGSPSEGDRYIVGPSATGVWSGHDDDIAEYVDSAWEFYIPIEGWRVDVKDENRQYRHTGTEWKKAPLWEGRLAFREDPTFNGEIFIVGWNIQTDSTIALASGSPITQGEPGYHTHTIIDVSAASGLPFTIRLTGTSVDEADGALTPGDTEDLNITANGYYQTIKSWITAPQLSIVEASKSCFLDIYRCTTWDRANTDFTVDSVRLEFEPDVAAWNLTLQIIHVENDGSLTYIDNVTFDESDTPPRADRDQPGKYKRTDYAHSVQGSANEGIMIYIDQTNIRSLFVEVRFSG